VIVDVVISSPVEGSGVQWCIYRFVYVCAYISPELPKPLSMLRLGVEAVQAMQYVEQLHCLCVYVYMYICMYIYMYIYMYIRVCVCVCESDNRRVNTRVRCVKCLHIHTHVYTYTHTHIP
jgi:hypothetical protein